MGGIGVRWIIFYSFIPHISRIFQPYFKNTCRTYQNGGEKTAICQKIKFCAAVNNRERVLLPWGTCPLGYFPLDLYPQGWYVVLPEGGEKLGTAEEGQSNTLNTTTNAWISPNFSSRKRRKKSGLTRILRTQNCSLYQVRLRTFVVMLNAAVSRCGR